MVKHRRKIHKSLSSSSSSSSSSTSSGKINVEENIGGFCGGDRVEVDETPLIDNSNVDIIVDDVTNNDKQRWSQLYSSPPIIDSKLILLFGIFIFGLSYTMIGRPLILLVFYMLSRFIPYAFRTNDNAVERRIQFKQFSKYPYHSDKFLNISNYVNLHESYWENDRYVDVCIRNIDAKQQQSSSCQICTKQMFHVGLCSIS